LALPPVHQIVPASMNECVPEDSCIATSLQHPASAPSRSISRNLQGHSYVGPPVPGHVLQAASEPDMLRRNKPDGGTSMRRRSFLRAGAAGVAAASLPRFSIAQSANARVLKFVPQANLT